MRGVTFSDVVRSRWTGPSDTIWGVTDDLARL